MDRQTLPQRIKMAANLATPERLIWAPASGVTWYLESLAVLPNASATPNATDYATIDAKAGIGSPSTLMTQRTTATTGFTQNTVEAFTLTGTVSQREITQANPFFIEVDTNPGAGVAVDLTFLPTFRVIRSA